MSQPCVQTGRVERIEANYDHLMKDVAEIKSDVKDVKNSISELERMFLRFVPSLDEKYVRKEEFIELEKCSTAVQDEIKLAKGFVNGIKIILGFLGLTSLAGLLTFLKVFLKLF